MKQLLVRKGTVLVDRVPAPVVERGTVLVRVDYSCISIGTELSGIRSSGLPLFRRAMQRPDQVRKVVRTLAEQGWSRTRALVGDKLSGAVPLGYSAAGIAIAVGEGVEDIAVGDRVTCAGAQCAHHAEIIRVPRNLVVPVPDGLDLARASTATLGAIAMQGVRRAAPTLGESFVVIGLGILGQITVQLLRANGCRAIGIDPDPERVRIALEHGMDAALASDAGSAADQVARLTEGIGADGVIITAAARSDEIVSTAFSVCRKKGRVVLVGDVGLNLRRDDIYTKELDFLISTSYGPGRYDRTYEEDGLDYPVGYVRWTENRNLFEYLRLMASGRIDVKPLIEAEYDVDDAPRAYAELQGDGRKPLMILIRYPRAEEENAATPTTVVRTVVGGGTGRVRVALVGAGGYAKAAHLPNLARLGELFELRAVVSRSGHNAVAAARQFGASYASTDFSAILADTSIDAVIIATRHHQHATMTLAALRAGKHVLVEKPLALTEQDVATLDEFFQGKSDVPLLLTGYNRRFSPYGVHLREQLAKRQGPMMLNYRMNAGFLPADHWVHSVEGGGRNLGEACHIYDLFTFLVGAPAERIEALAISPASAHYGRRDNFTATIRFDEGSVASLTYTALGSAAHPKEQMTVYSDGRVIVLDDYRELHVAGERSSAIRTRNPEKGQPQLLEAFGRNIRSGGEWPIPLWQQVQSARMALRVDALI